MNLEIELESCHAREQADLIAAWVGGNAARFASLFALFRNGPSPIQQSAGRVVECCCESHSSLILPHLSDLCSMAGQHGLHDSISRNAMKIMTFCPLPETHHGRVFEAAMRIIGGPLKSAAPKAYAISVARRITLRHPELDPEVRQQLQLLRHGAGAAVLSRMRKEFGL